MAGFFKSFGKGVLYTIGLPIYLVALAILGVFGLFVFLFQTIKCFFLFITGRKLFKELPEDIEAQKILAPKSETPVQSTTQNTQVEVKADIIKNSSFSSNTNEEIDFPIPEDNTSSTNSPNNISFLSREKEPVNNNNNIDNKPVEKEEKEEVIETYTPKSSKF